MWKTSLNIAIYTGNVKKVRKLLAKGISIDQLDYMMIQHTIYLRNHEILKLLLDAGINANIPPANGFKLFTPTPICLAASLGDLESVKLLIEHGADIRLKLYGTTPLLSALINGKIEIAKLLISLGASYGKIEQFLLNPTDADSNSLEESEINMTNAIGMTPLMAAVVIGNIEMVNRLIERNADINKRDIQGRSAFDYAVFRGNVEIAELLLRNNVNIQNKYYPIGCSWSNNNIKMLHLLKEQGVQFPQTILKSILLEWLSQDSPNADLLSLLLDWGLDIDSKFDWLEVIGYSFTALYLASSLNNVNAVRILIEKGAKISTLGFFPITITEMILNGRFEIARLIAYGYWKQLRMHLHRGLL